MYNVKIMKDINYFASNTIQEMWKNTLAEYGDFSIPLTIVADALEWNTEYARSDNEKLTSDALFNSEMLTSTTPLVKDGIIVNVEAGVIIGMAMLLKLIISNDLNLDKTSYHLKNVMRHEIGHILVATTFVGKSVDYWEEYRRLNNNNISQGRKNASHKKWFEWIIEYHSIPHEKFADEAAGITMKDWAKDFVLANPGYSRKKLGVDPYLTEEEFREIRKLF